MELNQNKNYQRPRKVRRQKLKMSETVLMNKSGTTHVTPRRTFSFRTASCDIKAHNSRQIILPSQQQKQGEGTHWLRLSFTFNCFCFFPNLESHPFQMLLSTGRANICGNLYMRYH